MQQQTTNVEQPEVELQNKTKDDEGKAGEAEQSAEDLAKALEEAVARGDIAIEVLGEKMVVNFTPTEQEQKNLPQLLQETLKFGREEAEIREITITELLMKGFKIMKEGQYIDFK